MKNILFVFIFLLFSCDNNFNKHEISINKLNVKNHIFLQDTFFYGFSNQKQNNNILILIPDNFEHPNKFSYIVVRSPDNIKPVLKTLSKRKSLTEDDLIEINNWFNQVLPKINKSNFSETLTKDEKKINLAIEKKKLNSIVLEYIKIFEQQNLYDKIENLKKSLKESDEEIRKREIRIKNLKKDIEKTIEDW